MSAIILRTPCQDVRQVSAGHPGEVSGVVHLPCVQRVAQGQSNLFHRQFHQDHYMYEKENKLETSEKF